MQHPTRSNQKTIWCYQSWTTKVWEA